MILDALSFREFKQAIIAHSKLPEHRAWKLEAVPRGGFFGYQCDCGFAVRVRPEMCRDADHREVMALTAGAKAREELFSALISV